MAVPKIIYASSKSSELFLEKLRQGTGPNPDADCFEVRLEKAHSFNPDAVCRLTTTSHSLRLQLSDKDEILDATRLFSII